jgi:hypothetical protein
VNVAVVMPYRPADEDRPKNLGAVRKTYDALDWPIYLGDHEGEFTTAIAKNVAATQAIHEGDPDVLFVTDSDLLIPHQTQVLNAARLAFEKDCYVIAYNMLCYLDWDGTATARAGQPIPEQQIVASFRDTWGGAFAISRLLWQRIGGYDPRFIGYGHDDLALTPCANTMGRNAKQRITGRCYHLMHPESDKSQHQAENAKLASRYRAADAKPEEMRALLAERCLG